MAEPDAPSTETPSGAVPASEHTNGTVKQEEKNSPPETSPQEPPNAAPQTDAPPEPTGAPSSADASPSLAEAPKCEEKNDTQEASGDAPLSTENVTKISIKVEDPKSPPAAASSATEPAPAAAKEESKDEETPAAPVQASSTAEEPITEEDIGEPKDPNMGRLVEQTKVLPSGQIVPLPGEVVAVQEASGRLPPRYTVEWRSSTDDDAVLCHDEWMASDMETPPIGNLQWALDHIQTRYQEQLDLELGSNQLVSTLLLYAAMEEALQTNLAISQQQQGMAEEGTSSKTIGKQDPHPPLYYTSNPSSYLKAPTATDTTATEPEQKVFMTPSSLAHRVRQGCQWAHRYVVAQQPPPPPPPVSLIAASTQRRSLRQPKPPPPPMVPKPTPVQQGGRVAMWWIEQLEEMAAGKGGMALEEKKEEDEEELIQEEETELDEEVKDNEEMKASEEATPKEALPKPDKKKKSPKKQSAAETNGDTMEVEEFLEDDEDDEESENKPDDDDDYGSKDAIEEDEEDEELEDVEKERKGNLSPVSDESMGGEEDAEDAEEGSEDEAKESEEDIQQAVFYDNPYLKPTFPSLLEYLSRPKALTGEDIQKAMADIILRVRFNKRSSGLGLETESLSTVDQVVLDQETPDYPPGKVVLKCVSEETYSELQKMEAQAFSRCKFALDVIGDEENTMQVQRHEELVLQELEFKEQKAWSKWRHKGIHEGYSKWPSWHDAIAEWVKANCTAATAEPAINDAAVVTSASQTDTSQDDEALAKSLEESEGTSGRRRTARRAAATASDGVFYGNQSQLTQKQLMDALIRLVKTNRFQTLLRLQALVAEDSSDPIRRSRVAVGKLVWKRNLLLRKSVDADLSDSGLIQSLAKQPLLIIPPPVPEIVEEITTETQPKELSAEEKGLIKYIQGLHAAELQLRRLVTKHLAEIPVTIIATAADERPGSTESGDAADFEDPSSIEWHTSGHDLLKKIIFRPAVANGNSTDMTPCFWYAIKDYSKSIESDADDKEEPDSKERRMRFRAVPVPPPGESWPEQETILLLTEAQVHAGIKAAELELKHRAITASDGNPFSGASGDHVTLIPVDAEEGNTATKDIHGRIVGYDNVVLEDDDEVEYRILVLPESGDSREAFWASLDIRADTASYVCQPVGESTTWYSIEQFDFHPGSEAHQQCEFVLNWLGRQSKAAPFAVPVDPVALNIPTYPQVVKHPMDLSTMQEKLENGQYSSILPGQTMGISPTSRMLNGPFRKDMERIFDNAMLFNPPDDWIYQAAAHLKKNVLKKIAELSQTADQKLSGAGRFRKKRSVYVDDDSDVDMYEYESDNDDDFEGGRKSRKRKHSSARGGAQKDEFAARAIEHPIRLQNTLREASNLRGPFANLPINLSPSSFSLPPRWSCRLSTGTTVAAVDETVEVTVSAKKRAQEMAELLELQKVVEANESANLRRSTRAHDAPTGNSSSNGRTKSTGGSRIEYFLNDLPTDTDFSSKIDIMKVLPSTRYEVEVHAEKLHEEYYSKLYQSYSNLIFPDEEGGNEQGFGVYSNGSFPPYMGRVVPISSWDEVSWEIRSPFVVPALRWVLRGLIQSGHLTAIEDMNADFSSGVVLTNDIYYWDAANLQPYEVLDLRELMRKKRANKEDIEDSEDEIEMSEYEKARAERVARNAERLKALGLA